MQHLILLSARFNTVVTHELPVRTPSCVSATRYRTREDRRSRTLVLEDHEGGAGQKRSAIPPGQGVL